MNHGIAFKLSYEKNGFGEYILWEKLFQLLYPM